MVLSVFVPPIVVVSKCIEFAAVRWDGQQVSSDLVQQLRDHVTFIPVCPEMAIGLGVPRDPLRLVMVADEVRLVERPTNRDVTDAMRCYAAEFLGSLKAVDGFVLKRGSPTSAIKDARVYPSTQRVSHLFKGPGVFGAEVLKRYPGLAIEDEGRLQNGRIREHFLTKLFALARFRAASTTRRMRSLIAFHAENKLLLKAYNQREFRILGRIVANQDRLPFEDVVSTYRHHLFKALAKPPRCGAYINVMMNAMGYFSDHLGAAEKAFLLTAFDDFRAGRIPLSVSKSLLNAVVIRFDEDYLRSQSFFAPYPASLVDINTTIAYCDGKDYWL
jgi:uncharacterized protein YbgA (DUF1722 family)/uncharacterized protein YbbK (DUF523 family)